MNSVIRNKWIRKMGGSETGLMANRNRQRRIYFPILLENTLVYGLHHIMVQLYEKYKYKLQLLLIK